METDTSQSDPNQNLCKNRFCNWQGTVQNEEAWGGGEVKGGLGGDKNTLYIICLYKSLINKNIIKKNKDLDRSKKCGGVGGECESSTHNTSDLTLSSIQGKWGACALLQSQNLEVEKGRSEVQGHPEFPAIGAT